MASEEEKMQGILETVDQQEMVGICGRNDEFLRLIRGAFDCTIVARGNQITMSGCAEEVAQLEQLRHAGGGPAAAAGASVFVPSGIAADNA